MKTWIAAVALFSMTGLVWADDVDESLAKLKEAVEKKDADTVKASAAETSKLARALVAAPQPSDATEVDHWKELVEHGKEVEAYTEYALGFTATQGLEPAKTIELVDQLLVQNPKSTYLDLCAGSYLAALEKEGNAAKQLEGAGKIVAGRPDNEDALFILAQGYGSKSPDRALSYANKMVAVMKSKPKPAGIPAADWDRKKSTMIGRGYYIAGTIEGGKQLWVDCDRNLRAALPFIGNEPSMLGPTYFYLGLSSYQLGKLTHDKSKVQVGLKYSQQSAAIKGPMQAQAYQNTVGMQRELATWR